MLEYKASVGKPLNPRNSTRRCSRRGGLNEAPKGAVFECEFCGLRINRRLNLAVNLYLQMDELPHDARWFDCVVGGFDLTVEKRADGPYEPSRGLSVVNPKEDVVAISHGF